MKKFFAITCACVLALSFPAMTVSAASEAPSSLDEIINQQETTDNEETNEQQPSGNTQSGGSTNNGTVNYGNGALVDELEDATDLGDVSPGATKINQGIKKVASFIIQVLAYFVTAMLVVRVVLDLCYITLPFTRSFLSNGYGGQAMGQPGMGQPGMGGMGGMGMGGMGMGGMGMGGMRGGYGMNRMGMGGMGMGGGMGMQGSQPGASPAMGRIQWISTAALNAAAGETMPGPDGKPASPLKVYAKDMMIVLVATPIFLVLAVTGTLTELGFLLGDLLANAISNIGGMF